MTSVAPTPTGSGCSRQPAASTRRSRWPGSGSTRRGSRFDALLRVTHPVQRRRRPVPPWQVGRERAGPPPCRRGQSTRINGILVEELLAAWRWRGAASRKPTNAFGSLRRSLNVPRTSSSSSGACESRRAGTLAGTARQAVAQVAAAIRLIAVLTRGPRRRGVRAGTAGNADVAELARARRSPDREHAAVQAGDELLAADAPTPRRRGRTGGRRSRRCQTRGSGCAKRRGHACIVRPTKRPGRPPSMPGRPRAPVRGRLRAVARSGGAPGGRGSRDAAAATLRSSLETAERLGAAPLAREVRALAARARIVLECGHRGGGRRGTGRRSGHRSSRADGAREREVLGLVALGRTNRQIADELFISENTAGVHVSNIIGMSARVRARRVQRRVAYRLGLARPVAVTD